MRRLSLLLLLLLLPLTALGDVSVMSEMLETPLTGLRVTVLEMGRSDAILLQCGGEAMLIDGGYAAYAKALQHDLESRGLRAMKYYLNTHPHNDHIEGLTALMDAGFKAERFLSPFPADLDDAYNKAAAKSAWENGVIYRKVRDGDVFLVGDAQVEILRDESGSSLNDKSAATMVTYGDARLLLGADLTGNAQKALLKAKGAEKLKADIVKAPHHGENAMVDAFLTAVAPELTVCTSAKDEAPALENQMKSRKIPLLYSGEGSVVLVTDGASWQVYQMEKQGRNRWQTADKK